jgi:hypothetical protein
MALGRRRRAGARAGLGLPLFRPGHQCHGHLPHGAIAVIYQVVGFKRTVVFVGLVVTLNTLAGMMFGA